MLLALSSQLLVVLQSCGSDWVHQAQECHLHHTLLFLTGAHATGCKCLVMFKQHVSTCLQPACFALSSCAQLWLSTPHEVQGLHAVHLSKERKYGHQTAQHDLAVENIISLAGYSCNSWN